MPSFLKTPDFDYGTLFKILFLIQNTLTTIPVIILVHSYINIVKKNNSVPKINRGAVWILWESDASVAVISVNAGPQFRGT